jgi:hypothetical protein
MVTARSLRDVALKAGLPLGVGSGILLATRTTKWLPLAAVAGVAVLSGTFAWGRKQGNPAPGASGIAVYPMQQPVRNVVGKGLPDKAPYTVRVTTHTHMSLTMSPGMQTGPTAIQIPLTGHNVMFLLTATGSGDVTVREIGAEVTNRTSLIVDGVNIAHRTMPLVLSPDLLESIQRSVEEFKPLEIPDFEILLDGDPALLRPLGSDTLSFPLIVPAGENVTIVFAPVTDDRNWVHWRLFAEIEYGGRTARPSWDLTVTAETCYADSGRLASVHELFPDHWDPSTSKLTREPGPTDSESLHVAFHGSDGERIPLSASPLIPEPEPRRAARRRKLGDRHTAQGRLEDAAAAYRAAAEAGSGEAAFRLGQLLRNQGDLESAERWYKQAAEQHVAAAFNNLGTLLLQRGDLAGAEQWFRRAIEVGDWMAAMNLGTLVGLRGELAQAETLLRLAAKKRCSKRSTQSRRRAQRAGAHR